jgi:hypothetical protein
MPKDDDHAVRLRRLRGVGPDIPLELLSNNLADELDRLDELHGLVDTLAGCNLHSAVDAIDQLLRHLYRLRDELVGKSRENQRRSGLG